MPTISFTAGPLQGQEFELTEQAIRLGRAPGNDLVFDDTAVSGKHAELRPVNGQWQLQDLDSANGTKVNAEAIESCWLQHQDVVTVGNTQFIFLDQTPLTAAANPPPPTIVSVLPPPATVEPKSMASPSASVSTPVYVTLAV